MVTTQSHIKQLNEAPLNTLSLHAVAKDVSRMALNEALPINGSIPVSATKIHHAWV